MNSRNFEYDYLFKYVVFSSDEDLPLRNKFLSMALGVDKIDTVLGYDILQFRRQDELAIKLQSWHAPVNQIFDRDIKFGIPTYLRAAHRIIIVYDASRPNLKAISDLKEKLTKVYKEYLPLITVIGLSNNISNKKTFHSQEFPNNDLNGLTLDVADKTEINNTLARLVDEHLNSLKKSDGQSEQDQKKSEVINYNPTIWSKPNTDKKDHGCEKTCSLI